MRVIVKYNNELNLMPMPKLKGTQYDLFFSIISLINEKHNSKNILQQFFDSETRKLEIPFERFINMCRINDWKCNCIEIQNEIQDFLKILVDFKVEYATKNNYYVFSCFEEAEYDKMQQKIKITFQERFYDMVVNYKLGFTFFELAEFISLSGKYTKTLYRFLKQYRNTGYLKLSWNDFLKLLDISKEYRMCDIDFRILKPAIKELTKPKTLLNQTRIPFKNLSYTKLKGHGRGRGGNVIGIEFSFEPEVTPEVITNTNDNVLNSQDTMQTQKPVTTNQQDLVNTTEKGAITNNAIHDLLKSSLKEIREKTREEKSLEQGRQRLRAEIGRYITDP